jgi:CRISPR-associated protein Csb2
MPDLKHVRGSTRNTDQVIDAFLAVPTDDPLLIHWDADLSTEDREVLRNLFELTPYLGRSESMCEATLICEEITPDSSWWRVDETEQSATRVSLLAPDSPLARELLETTTVATRKARRRLPVGSRKITYARVVTDNETPTPRTGPPSIEVDCLHFQLSTSVPLRSRDAILAADAVHAAISKAVDGVGMREETAAFVGRDPTGGPRRARHDHLHVLPVPAQIRSHVAANEPITSIYVWRPSGIPIPYAAAIQQISEIRTRQRLTDAMAPQRLLVAETGIAAHMLPQVATQTTSWVSATPYLPVRHRKKRQELQDFLKEDIAAECGYRGIGTPASVTIDDDPKHQREAVQYRRRRTNEALRVQRIGLFMRLTFSNPVSGPLLLGQLSHFGYGLFVPDGEIRK